MARRPPETLAGKTGQIKPFVCLAGDTQISSTRRDGGNAVRLPEQDRPQRVLHDNSRSLAKVMFSKPLESGCINRLAPTALITAVLAF